MTDGSSLASPFRFLVIGAGKRVINDVLPAMNSLEGEIEVRRVYSRSARDIEFADSSLHVDSLFEITTRHLEEIDGIYVAVPSNSVQMVLRQLSHHEVSHIDLVVDTPIWAYFPEFDAFRTVTTAEDSYFLPWLNLMREALANQGGASLVLSYRALYAYHGVALYKALVTRNLNEPVSTLRSRWSFGPVKNIKASNTRFVLVEPRSYPKGKLVIRAKSGRIFSSHRLFGTTQLHLIAQDNSCVGFSLGQRKSHLIPQESALIGPVSEDDTVVSKMLELKKVGLRTLLSRVAMGGVSYDVSAGINDTSTSVKARSD